MRDENFEFPDLLGAAYEYQIKYFADSAGKKAGEFYTPADVVRTLVEIVDPQAGMSIYDPTCGSGGMLIQTRDYVVWWAQFRKETCWAAKWLSAMSERQGLSFKANNTPSYTT